MFVLKKLVNTFYIKTYLFPKEEDTVSRWKFSRSIYVVVVLIVTVFWSYKMHRIDPISAHQSLEKYCYSKGNSSSRTVCILKQFPFFCTHSSEEDCMNLIVT